MYRINKVYNLPADMELPKTMYSMQPINDNEVDGVSNANGPSREALSATNRNIIGNINEISRGCKQENSGNKKKPSSSSASLPKDSNNSRNRNEVKPVPKMKNETTSADNISDDKIISKLEARQQEVIQKLLRLKEMLDNISSGSAVTTKPLGVLTTDETLNAVDVVVNADPVHPPLSVLFLTKLLKDSYGPEAVSLQSYYHSSCPAKNEDISNLFRQPVEKTSEDQKQIKISVIWKQVEAGEPQLLVHPTAQAPVIGEANVARFLSRLLPASHPVNHDNLSLEDIIRVDAALENSVHVANLNDVERQLKAGQSFLLGEPTLVDFVTVSTVAPLLKRNPQQGGKVSNVSKWFSACQTFVGCVL